ncbi:lytic polysaccharide monooxygenase [Streptomyces sp. CB03238]|uniref:lytic polysaccharide monooxygenase auxiliary activity family 9 protein n=1 Tax=Streptomyces sp. CB03238 TaxID=1907777 RepID=UPI000A116D99|nr:lytic polysaccharide monooxygenase [Streptomyces sp. CB03238]ORT57576.1 chitin-binding protein [Streptomyces sp. CB03238]
MRRGSRVRRRLRTPLSLLSLLAVLPALLMVVMSGSPAAAHGAMMQPGSRTFLCWKDGLTPQGNIDPKNPACDAAVAQSGDNSLYNWFSVLRSDGGGRTEGFKPDGKLCSGGNPGYAGFDLPRTDWPLTHLTSGASLNFSYNAWAAHPGWFHLYVTKDGYDPERPLAWDDLEDQPFLTVDHPRVTGQVGTLEGQYKWTAALPANKTGRHIIYSVWQRSDSQETFYGCSDVVFDGGNGEVTGVGDPAGNPGPTPTPTPPTGACAATQRTVNAWSGGYQAEVTVKNNGTTPIPSWMVHATLPDGQRVASLWNGTLAGTGTAITVSNTSWNGSLAPGATTTYGFTATGGAPPTTPQLSCMVHHH